MDLKGKTYTVSNATSLLGKDLAKKLAEEGANLILSGQNHVELDTLLSELEETTEGTHNVVLLQPSKEIDWLNVLEEIENDYDSLTGIIFVHSIFTENRSIYDVSFEEFNEVMYEHVWGTYLGTRTLRPLLKDETDAKIINVIEPSFEDVFERNLYYTTTGAIEALTHSTAVELSKEDVEVYALSYRPSMKHDEEDRLERSNPEAISVILDILTGKDKKTTGETIIIN